MRERDPVCVVGLRPYWSKSGSSVCCCRFEALLERESGSSVCCCRFEALLEREWIQCVLL